MLLLVALLATLVVVNWPRPRPHTKLIELAKETTPEVALLLREVDTMVCDLLEQYPDTPEAIDVAAHAHYRLGEAEEALKYWKQCLQLDKNFCPAYHSMGLMYLEIGKHDQAARYFRKALDLQPESSAFTVELAQALIANGDTREAAKVLRSDIRRHPRNMAALAMLGHACIQLRQYEEAREYFLRAIEIAPDYTNAYNGLVTACANLGDEKQAKRYAEKLKTMKASEELGHREMLKSFDDVVNVQQTMGVLYTAAANVYLAHNDPVMAERYLKKSTKLAPEMGAAREILGWLYQKQGRKQEAGKITVELLEMAPDNLSAQITGGQLAAALGRFDTAERAYRRAIELTPKLAGGYAALAGLFLDQRTKLDEALQLAQQAVDLEPVAKHYFLLGAAHLSHGDARAARSAVERANQLDPNNVEYKQVLQSMGPPGPDGP